MTDGSPTTPSSTFARWMGTMWLYTLLRFGLFAVLWAIVWILGVSALTAALVALLLSVPLSFVLLAKPRAAFAAQIEARVDAHRIARAQLDKELDPGNAEDASGDTDVSSR